MDTLYRLLEWNPVQVGSTFQGGEGGVGVLDIDLPIFSPEQALKPVPLLRKANSR